jgi:hypothetical protein
MAILPNKLFSRDEQAQAEKSRVGPMIKAKPQLND